LRHQAQRALTKRFRALRQQMIAMGERSAVQGAGRCRTGERRRHRTLRNVDLAFGKVRECLRRHGENFLQHLGGYVADPIADAERAEFREIAVVEHQQELTILVADAFDRMTEPAREVPDIAGGKVDDLCLVLRVDRGDAALPLDHIGPFRRVSMPVQFAQPAGRELHQHAGKFFGNGKLGDRRLLRPPAVPGLRSYFAQFKTERGKLRAGEHRRCRAERRLSVGRAVGRGGCSGDHAAGCAQDVSP